MTLSRMSSAMIGITIAIIVFNVEGIKVTDVAEPWLNSETCGLQTDRFSILDYDESLTLDDQLCDSDGTLDDIQRVLMAEMLRECQLRSEDNTSLVTLLARDIQLKEKQKKDDDKSAIDSLVEKVLEVYHAKPLDPSAVLLVVVEKPFEVQLVRMSDSAPTMTQVNTTEMWNSTMIEETEDQFYTKVSFIINHCCQEIRRKSDPFFMEKLVYNIMMGIVVAIYFAASLGIIICFIKARSKRHGKDKSGGSGEGRRNPNAAGSSYSNPVSYEMRELGGTAILRPPGHLVLGSSDIMAVTATASSVSTDNLITS